jgi:two-component system, NtrC family, response regulator PilR
MTMVPKGLLHVIDDEPVIHDVLGQLLTSEGYAIEPSTSGEEALAKLADRTFDLTLLDLLMPGMDGIEVLRRLKRVDPEAMVIIITAYASVESAIAAMKLGAFDYIQKPFKHDDLLMTVGRALEHRRLRNENTRLKTELHRKFGFENIIGKSKPMQGVFELINAAAPTRSTILVQGESGTGKELVARAIHDHSERTESPFITVNSGSLPPDLLESHLFGHVKGAFTGAVTLKTGLFEAADRGTLFFDEISSLNLETQAKLLRVLQEKEFMRLGGTKTIKVDTRIIAATNTDLEELIRQKTFRKDLFYRLNVINVYAAENKKAIEGVSEDVYEILDRHAWPGNVRELENLIERAVVLAKSPVISRDTLPPFFLKDDGPADDVPESEGGTLDFKERTRFYQKKIIQTALRRTKGVQKKAAQMLGIKPTTLNEMIKRLEIDTDDL